jgi:AcrR family transcriptional regulator
VLSNENQDGEKLQDGQGAEARDLTRERIVRATMQVHDEKGVAPTTLSEIAERAGVGLATVTRHFPTPGELVRTCGAHVWQEMRPPVPETAAAVFTGSRTPRERLERLVAEVDGFYARGAHRLALAARDRQLVPELDRFLSAVEAGVGALVNEALADAGQSERTRQVVLALMTFQVWSAFDRLALPPSEALALRVGLLECAIKAARQAN